jgi:hypothetical protein
MLYPDGKIPLSKKVDMLNKANKFIKALEKLDFIRPISHNTPFIETTFVGRTDIGFTRDECNMYSAYDDIDLIAIRFDFIKECFVLEHRFLELPDMERPTIKNVLAYFNYEKDDFLEHVREEYKLEHRKKVEERNAKKQNKGQIPCTIYLALDKGCNYYKIGRTANKQQREDTLMATRPTIEIIGHYQGVQADEKHLHQVFTNKGLHVRGEWFNLSKADLDFIHKYFTDKTN